MVGADRMKHFADEETPSPGKVWKNSLEEERKKLIYNILARDKKYRDIQVQYASDDGRVVLRTERTISANERGLFYLELEAIMKRELDMGISLWCEPVGDKSKLRALRGVTF